MNQKQAIAVWCVIIAIALFSILGRVLFPVYRDVFHGIIVLMLLVALLSGGAISPSETKKAGGHKMAERAKHKASIPTAARGRHKRPRKRPAAQRMRKRKKLSGR